LFHFCFSPINATMLSKKKVVGSYAGGKQNKGGVWKMNSKQGGKKTGTTSTLMPASGGVSRQKNEAPQTRSITPYITVGGGKAADAIEFYVNAFGGREITYAAASILPLICSADDV
jgi:hypothetical protein